MTNKSGNSDSEPLRASPCLSKRKMRLPAAAKTASIFHCLVAELNPQVKRIIFFPVISRSLLRSTSYFSITFWNALSLGWMTFKSIRSKFQSNGSNHLNSVKRRPKVANFSYLPNNIIKLWKEVMQNIIGFVTTYKFIFKTHFVMTVLLLKQFL